MEKNKVSGFTLIEIVVVVAIIGVLTTIILASLNKARTGGVDGAVKSNMRNALNQAEIAYGTRTANKDSYTSICTNGILPSETTVRGIGSMVLSAAKANGISSFASNGTGTGTTATCNNTVATAYAAEVPLSGSTNASPVMWCIDSTGKNKQTSASIGATNVCP